MNAFDVLKERNFVKQCSDERALKTLFSSSKIVFYVGFEPTAESLHIGHLLPIMAMANLQKLGHTPIILIGGATGLIGDPSGKTEMRKMLTREQIACNIRKILPQFNRYLKIGEKDGLLLNNADWLTGINYIDFLREIGQYFKVNEMIKNEGYRLRMEREEGLSFIEFNYQLLQAYDFLILFEKHGCMLQIGGDDQWGNILAGTSLVRKVKKETVFALTIPLITTATGQKMGKTESGAIWLDSARTSPYDFYQYWINIDDKDVIRFLFLFTFLPKKEIQDMEKLHGAELRVAKEILAFEATKLAHGEDEAKKAKASSKAIFSKTKEDRSALPTTHIKRSRIISGILATDLFFEVGLVPSKSAVQRLIKQGGAYVNEKKVNSSDKIIDKNDLENDSLILRHGKKQYRRVVVDD